MSSVELNDSLDVITRYFPALSAEQLSAFGRLGELYADWNSKINVISRNDIPNLYTRHVLHSLAIAAFLGELEDGTTFMDLGTGGGFPGVPLAIFYPHCRFHLIDRINKKIRVATEICTSLGIDNVTFQHGDSGECRTRFDYVVSRAVMPLDALWKACAKNIEQNRKSGNKYAPGLVCLKGGDLGTEIASVHRPVVDVPISDFFNDPFFDTKEILYVK